MGLTGTVQPVGFTPSSETPTPPVDFYAVLYIPQDLSPSQKEQVLINIGALPVGSISGLISAVSFNAETSTLIVQQQNGISFDYQLVNNQGVSNVGLDGNNDLVVDFLNGNNTIVPINNLFSGFIKKINGKEGTEISIGIDDIQSLTEELNNRVPVGITIKIDGIEKNLQENPEFDTNSVKFEAQEVSLEKQQIVRNTLDVYSKQEVIDLIGSTTTIEALFEHLLTPGDLANTIMPFTLPQPIKGNSKGFMYIGSAPVSPNSYEVHGTDLKIDQTKFDYELQANRRLIFRYNS